MVFIPTRTCMNKNVHICILEIGIIIIALTRCWNTYWYSPLAAVLFALHIIIHVILQIRPKNIFAHRYLLLVWGKPLALRECLCLSGAPIRTNTTHAGYVDCSLFVLLCAMVHLLRGCAICIIYRTSCHYSM